MRLWVTSVSLPDSQTFSFFICHQRLPFDIYLPKINARTASETIPNAYYKTLTRLTLAQSAPAPRMDRMKRTNKKQEVPPENQKSTQNLIIP